jgi:beta-glucosidase
MEAKFLWGVATSAFQLEGSPCADWSVWDACIEKTPNITQHYHLYKEDLRLLKDLGVNAYRFSLEWSRIQPQEDVWDDQEIARYQEIIHILNENQIVPVVTLHHFTHPAWFNEKYGWHEDQAAEIFLRYVDRLLPCLHGVNYWITLNEPYVLLLGGYLDGSMPPGIKSITKAYRALNNMLTCHGLAYDLIHAWVPDAKVSLAHNMAVFDPCSRWSPLDRYLCRMADDFYNRSLIEALKSGILTLKYPLRKPFEAAIPIKGKADFFGVNYYTRIHLRFNPLKKMGVELRNEDRGGFGLTDMGWEIHPDGLEKTLRSVAPLNVPIFITENGIAARDSQKKNAFMKQHLDVVERCRKRGIDVRGYFYWSLMDNYEWLHGLDARFGLYRVDYDTLQRRPTNSAAFYAYLIKTRSAIFND